jgi:uncharacterized membrane protein YhaH (DUF805 family)
MDKKGKGDNPWRAAGMVGVMGADVAICVTLGFFLGRWLGGSTVWVAVGTLVGLAVGILTCVVLVKRLLEDSDG